MALLFAGTAMWRLPATTSTCRGGSAARSVAAEKGTAAAAGAGDLADLRSRAGAAGAAVLTAAVFLFLRLIRVTASWTSLPGGNQKSQSFRTTPTSATNRIPN